MPSRGKVKANRSIFQGLEIYCANRGEPIANEGSDRWINTEQISRGFLTGARKVQVLHLAHSLKIGRFDYANRSFFITAGYELLQIPQGLQEEELTGGLLTVCLSEMQLRPTAIPIQIREVVEVGYKQTPGYDGHDFQQMASLFPAIQVLSSPILEGDESESVFFLICLADRRRSDHWIDEELATTLAAMATVSSKSIPYEALCRAVLDFDPGSLFLALYRCLEALYSRQKTKALMADLCGGPGSSDSFCFFLSGSSCFCF